MRKIVQFLLIGAPFALLTTVALLGEPDAHGFADAPGAKPANYDQTLPDSEVKFTMVGIPGGTS